MIEQEKNDKESMICLNTETKPKFFCLPYTKQRTFFFTEKGFLRKKGSGGFKKNEKNTF